jgi:thioredoxin 1
MSRVLDEIKERYAGELNAEKINVQEDRETARQYNVMYVPTLLFVGRDGEILKQDIGYKSLDEVIETFRAAGVVL